MSVIGSLEDLAFPDVLQLIRASRRSGTLILSLRDGERRVYFKDGLIGDALLGPGGPELGDLLLRSGTIEARTLAEARERMRRTGERTAEALVAMGALARESVEQVVRDELRASLRSVILAQEGEFRFELEEEAGRTGSETVLLLAERTVVRRAVLDELRRSGFEVIVCAGAAEVLEHARRRTGEHVPFVVVSDLILPDSSGSGWTGGLDLLKSVRRMAPRASGVLLGELRARGDEAARSAGATAFVPLPDLGTTGLEGVGAALAKYAALVRDAVLHPGRFAAGGAPGGPVLAVDHVSLLRGLLGELHSEEEVAIPLLVLRLAAEYLERGILFSIQGHEAHGSGAFGDDPVGGAGRLDSRVRGVVLPLKPGSVLERAAATRATYVGRIDSDDPAGGLVSRLGGRPPRESALLPIAAGRQVFSVLYGDNARSGRPVGDLRGLEIFTAQAGIALHNAALKRRLSELSAATVGSGAHA